jgi:hypothetical protein
MGTKKGPLRGPFFIVAMKALALHFFSNQLQLLPAVEHKRSEKPASNEQEQNTAVDGRARQIASPCIAKIEIVIRARRIARTLHLATAIPIATINFIPVFNVATPPTTLGKNHKWTEH